MVIDMHASDGHGADEPQLVIPFQDLDLFDLAISDASPITAERLARLCNPPADVLLCESSYEKRQRLRALFHHTQHVSILQNHTRLMQTDFSLYRWALIFNDPCGHSGHGVEVLEYLSRTIPKSDFIIVVNEGSLGRHLGMNENGEDNGENAHLIAGARETKEFYRWMLDPHQWRIRLGKKEVCWYGAKVMNKAFHGRVLVVSNYLADPLRKNGWKH